MTLPSWVVSFNPNNQKHLHNLLITLQLDQQCWWFVKFKSVQIVQIWVTFPPPGAGNGGKCSESCFLVFLKEQGTGKQGPKGKEMEENRNFLTEIATKTTSSLWPTSNNGPFEAANQQHCMLLSSYKWLASRLKALWEQWLEACPTICRSTWKGIFFFLCFCFNFFHFWNEGKLRAFQAEKKRREEELFSFPFSFVLCEKEGQKKNTTKCPSGCWNELQQALSKWKQPPQDVGSWTSTKR